MKLKKHIKKHAPKLAHLMPSLAVLWAISIYNIGGGDFELDMSVLPHPVRTACLAAILTWMYSAWYLPDASTNGRKLEEMDRKIDKVVRALAKAGLKG